MLDKQHVNVVRHNDERDQRQTLAVEKVQCLVDNAHAINSVENAGAMASIEPLVNRGRESLVILLFDFRCPRLAMKL